MNKRKFIFIYLLWTQPLLLSAATWYVTQSGAGNQTGTSVGNAWSVAEFNAQTSPKGGDTVTFQGTLTTTITPGVSGTGNAGNRLMLDFSGATLNTANPRINVNGQSFLNINGGTFGAGSSTLITFNNTPSHDVTIANWTYTGGTTDTAEFVWANSVTNAVIENNTIDNIGTFVDGDQVLTHDLTIRNNYVRTSLNTTDQTDIIRIGDAYNVTIEGNKLIQQTQGATSVRHNDCIQTYMKGGSNAGNPYGWIIRYNWIELNVQGGSGDTSWLMLENMANHGTTAACKIYSNVFVGDATDTGSNNGTAPNSNDASAVFYFYNNTVIRKAGPDNTIRFLAPGTLYARNNIGYATSSGQGTYLNWTMTPGTGGWDNNWFTNFSAASNYIGPHGGTNDPQLTDVTNNDFSLKSTSPLIAAGDATIGSEYNQGIAVGATWPNPTLGNRASWDIGAYVFGGAPSSPNPHFHYVRSGAAGASTGADWNNAWTQLPATLIRGDTYYLADGNYNGTTFDEVASGNLTVTIKKAVASGDHGTSVGWQNSFGVGQAVFTSQVSFTTPYWIFDGQVGGGPGNWTGNVTPFGFKVLQNDGSGVAVISVTGSNVVLRHVEAVGNGPDGAPAPGFGNDGIQVTGDGLTVSYASLHDLGRCPVYGRANNLLFEFLTTGKFESYSSEHAEIASMGGTESGLQSNITFRNSLFTDVEGTGGLMFDGSNFYVYGNVFYHAPGATWNWGGGNGLIGAKDSGATLNNVNIHNNTFFETGSNVYGFYLTPAQTHASNNLYYGDVGLGVTPTGTGDVATSAVGLFKNAASLDFTLTSQLLGGANAGSPYNIDPLGNARTTWSAGAYEFGGSIPTPTPTPAPTPGTPATETKFLPFKNIFSPANESLTIKYTPNLSAAKLTVYDRHGNEIKNLPVNANGQSIWDGRSSGGSVIASGSYLAVLERGGKVAKTKIVAVK